MKKKNKLQIYIHTNERVKERVEQVLCRAIAQSIYRSKEFQEYISTPERREAILKSDTYIIEEKEAV